MADNVLRTAPGSGDTFATDDAGGVHYQYIKLADGTLNSTTVIAGSALGLFVVPHTDQIDVSIQPTIDTAVYADGDRLGAVGTFTSAARSTGGSGTIVGATMVDDAASNFDIELWVFKVSPTMANADNGVFDITDANIATAIWVCTIDFLAANSKLVSTTNRVCPGTWLNGPPSVPYVTSGSANLFGIMKARGAYDAAATDDLVVTLTVIRD
jgi:hypothetical protein